MINLHSVATCSNKKPITEIRIVEKKKELIYRGTHCSLSALLSRCVLLLSTNYCRCTIHPTNIDHFPALICLKFFVLHNQSNTALSWSPLIIFIGLIVIFPEFYSESWPFGPLIFFHKKMYCLSSFAKNWSVCCFFFADGHPKTRSSSLTLLLLSNVFGVEV